MPIDPRALWQRIDEILKSRPVSEVTSEPWAWLAGVAKLSERTFTRWSKGQNEPRQANVDDIARALEMSPADLVKGLPPPTDAPPPSSGHDPWYDHTMVATAATFVGRRELIEGLEAEILVRHSTNLVGAPGVGKTSVLARLEENARAQRRRTVSLISSQGVELTPQAFVAAITKDDGVPEPLEKAATALRTWCEARGRLEPPLVLVDAFDAFAEEIPHRFFERVRELIQAKKLVMVLATERTLGQISIAGKTSPLANVLMTLWVELLDDADAAELVGHAPDQLGEDGAARILAECGGHPWFAKLLAGELLRARRRGRPQAEALNKFHRDAVARLERGYKRLTPHQCQALRGLAGGAPLEQKMQNELAERGFVTREGRLFGEVVRRWLEEMSCDEHP